MLRADLAGNPSFTSCSPRSGDKSLAAYEHQDVPFDVIVEAINPERSAAYQPLFQVIFAWQSYTKPDLALPGLDVAFEQAVPSTAMVDLTFFMAVDDSGTLRGDLQYATKLFDRASAQTIVARLVRVLEQLAADPGLRVGDVDVLIEGERDRLVPGADDTAAGIPDATWSSCSSGRRRGGPTRSPWSTTAQDTPRRTQRPRQPARPAPRHPRRGPRVPRRDLPGALRRPRRRPPRGPQGGRAYLPIDPAPPADRIAYLVEDARPVLLVTTSTTGAAHDLAQDPPQVLLDRTEPHRTARRRPHRRRAPLAAAPRPPGVRHLHLGFHRPPQGRADPRTATWSDSSTPQDFAFGAD